MADDRYSTDYAVGQDNIERFGMDIHHPVFVIATVLILVFVIGTLIFPESAKVAFDGSKGWSIENFDWLFMLGGNIFVIFVLALIVLPVGKVRIGGPGAKPEFSTLSWFGMLFAAGMGIGLMFWSVAEPTAYYTAWYGTPLGVTERTPEGYDLALGPAPVGDLRRRGHVSGVLRLQQGPAADDPLDVLPADRRCCLGLDRTHY